MKMSKKETALVIGLLGGLVLILSWFYLITPLKEKTQMIESENVALKEKADLYISINANKDEYITGIEKMEASIETIIDRYPISISRTDEIMFLTNMEAKLSDVLAIQSMNMSTAEEVAPVADETADTSAVDEATQQAQADVAAAEAVEALDGETVDPTYQNGEASSIQSPYASMDLHLYKQPINYTFRCTYTGAKDMLNFLYAQANKKGVSTLNLGFDAESGNLVGTIGLNQYYMVGTNKEYEPITIPHVHRGVDDVFHTFGKRINAPVVVNEESEE